MNDVLQTLLSWPAVAIVAMIILHKQIGQLTTRFIKGDGGKAKIGHIEIELGELTSAQKKQEEDIATLEFLVGNFVNKHEIKHLKKIKLKCSFSFS